MERLYAVPSEKLRVWAIWLSKIGEIADEWQRWLRAHIDFTIRLMEQLQAAEEALRKSEKEDQPEKVSSQVVEEEAEVPQEAGDSDRGADETMAREEEGKGADETKEGDEQREEDIAEGIEEGEVVAAEGEETQEVVEEDVADTTEKSDEVVEDIGEKRDESEDTGIKMWPLGRPWEHLGLEDESDEEPFERLPLPTNEAEMKEFLKTFTYQATIYRSYYKHWKETADQAISEIGGRDVFATFIIQGKDETGQIKKPKLPPKPKKKPCKSSKVSIKKSTTKKVAKSPKQSPAEPSDTDGEEPPAPPPPIVEEPSPETPDDATETPDEATETPAEATEMPAEATETPAEDAPPAEPPKEPSKEKMSTEEPTSSKDVKTDEKKKSKARVIEASDLVRDCARAEEPLPYIFYVKAEPDIDIALEHDDQVVIEEDTDRENIVGDFKCIFFNLTDKPCKGGKPWMF
ncbi:hypothetical protein ANTPLA_LOCUS7475 [Anthophora plagiata]